MYSVRVIQDTDVLETIRDTAKTARPALRRELGQVARGPVAQAMLRAVSREPEAPDHPIHWTSDRQRKAVMAKLRRAKLLLYPRSHRLSQGWRVVLNSLSDSDGLIGLENDAPETDYVQGENQQRYLSKWPLARQVFRDHEDAFQEAIIDAWYKVVSR